MEMFKFHVDSKRHHNNTRTEVDSSENNDEQSSHNLLTTSPEHPQYSGITDGADSTEQRQKNADDITRSGRRVVSQVLLQLIL